MRVKIILISICAVLFLCLPTTVRCASADKDLLNRRVGPIVIRGETIDRILETISDNFDISMGIDLVDKNKSPDRKLDLDSRETDLRSLLDLLVVKDPRYMWKVEGQVVHFSPITDRDELLATLLDITITHVSLSSELSQYRMKYGILTLPEIEAKLAEAQVEPMILVTGPSLKKVGVSLEHSNLTLRELLDRITLDTTQKCWVLARWGKDNQYIVLRL